MAAGTIYRKTERGVAEVGERKLKLSARVRTMLILVDGVLTESQLDERAAQIGASEEYLQVLLEAGLIEAHGSLKDMLR